MSDRTHEYLAVDRALTGFERTQLTRRWYEINPHQRGAMAADILEHLDSTDAHLDVIEPIEDAHRDDYPRRPIGLCALAVMYAYGETEPGTCRRCGGAGKVAGNMVRPAQDPCGRCDGSGIADGPVARWELIEPLLRRVILPGDVIKLTAGALPDALPADPDLRPPVHAFRVETDGTVGRSLCGRVSFTETDGDPKDMSAYLDVELDRRCGFCDGDREGVALLRSIGAKIEGPGWMRPGRERPASFYGDRSGEEVIFRYYHGEEVRGVVSSANSRNVFVIFYGPDGDLRDHSEACSPDRLRMADEEWTGED